MSSAVEVAEAVRPAHRRASLAGLGGAGWSALLSLAVLLLGGYHPFTEDGGLYLAGVQWQLDPSLYRSSADFVTAHLRYSIFAPAVAGTVRATGLSLETAVLGLHLLCLWGTLGAGWLLAREVFATRSEWMGATAVLAAGLALPVAGTSLVIADPYLTARSFSTVGCLLGLVAALRSVQASERASQWRWFATAGLAMAAAGAFHPLMTGYGAACAALLLGTARLRGRQTWLLAAAAASVALLLCGSVVATSPVEEAMARAAGLSRSYWFLTDWRWYELAGLWAPALLLLAFGRWACGKAERALARAMLLAATVSVLVAGIFARSGAASFAVARLQPLRLFQMVYAVLFVLLGGALSRALGRCWRRWLVAAIGLAVVCAGWGWAVAPDLPRLELPWGQPPADATPWVDGFVWVRQHVPRDALVALDAAYISAPGEGAENFRAIAQRASLPDAAKDGGEAAITPRLAEAWARGVRAQQGLSTETDAERRRRLLPLGVSWVVLQKGAVTALPCPFHNEAMLVCRLPAS